MSKRSKLSLFKKTLIIIGVVIIVSGIITALNVFRKIYSPNVVLTNKSDDYVYVKTGSTLEDVCRNLYEHNLIVNRSSFEWVAEKKHYTLHIKAGRYKLKSGMSNNELIDLLRSGNQDPVRVSINNIRTLPQLAGIVGRQLECDSAQLISLLINNDFLKSFDVDSYTAMTLFIPNTYDIFWNTTAHDFIKRMASEQKKFWNTARLEKCEKIGLSSIKVTTLASIVDEESNKNDEFAIIAGVYINRLKKEMPLQADPTVKFALGDFSLKRILKKHTEIESPYNTYKYRGLPPGPIAMPSVKTIDAVLNYQKHSYLYFCAKSDFSGYHTFAKNLLQHNQNAKAYQNALNKKRIFN